MAPAITSKPIHIPRGNWSVRLVTAPRPLVRRSMMAMAANAHSASTPPTAVTNRGDQSSLKPVTRSRIVYPIPTTNNSGTPMRKMNRAASMRMS